MKEEILKIIQEHKERPNKDLVKGLDVLNEYFNKTKSQIINLSKSLDEIEKGYNILLKEYNQRNQK